MSDHVDLKSQQKVMLSSRARWRRFLLIIKVHRVYVLILTNPPPVISLLGLSARGGGVHSLPPAYISAFSSAGTNGDVPDESSLAVPDNQVSIEVVHLDVEVDDDDDDDDYCSRARDNANLQRSNIVKIVKEKDIDSLQSFGGVGGIAKALCTDLELGIHIPGDDEESTSTSLELPYARESAEAAQLSTTQATEAPRRGLFRLLKKYCNNCNILLLSLCAALSTGFGIKEEGWKTGWYEGAIITVAIFILILAPSIHDFIRQPRSQRLSEMHKPIDETGVVIRGGCRKELSISNIVVGDVACLTSGSPIPGDGLFIVSGDEVLVIEDVLGEMMNKVSNTHSKNSLPAQLEKLKNTAATKGIIDVIKKIVIESCGKISPFRTSLAILLVGIQEQIPFVIILAMAYRRKTMFSRKEVYAQELLASVTIGSAKFICAEKLYQPEVSICYVEDPLLPWAASELGTDMEISRQNSTVLKIKALNSHEEGSGVLMAKCREHGRYDHRVYWKGPATTILAMCSRYHESSGEIKEMDVNKRGAFKHTVEMQSAEFDHLKILAFAYKDVDVSWTLISFITIVSLVDVPITAIQLILANFIVNLVGGFALLNIATQTLYQTSILVAFHFKGKNLLGIGEQVSFNEISHILVDCARLNKAQWVLCLIMGFILVPIDTTVKLTTSFIKFHTLFPQTGSTSFSSSILADSESSVSSILELSQQGKTPNQL
ncbi:hypothetical protein FEM48_Zijuj01G0084100 [Ziziphus jujuba var. spinosa]|uniref:Calcium-transporting ATPase 12, plasma membrane-type-like n=1 Tax=Ziziphus jujuba var. spinosa TaxID=714518 RepID=A0A978W064_ZIZJJ|nr:hypothetical protein FEM48_Zijuj01G0084100 [Ziziphus jujuba var. spinosa]